MGGSRSSARGERCWQCGAPVRPGATECRYCGAQLASDFDESAYQPARRPEPSRRREGDERAARRSRNDEPARYNDDNDDEYDDRPGRSNRPSNRSGSRNGRSDRDERGGRSGRPERGRRFAEPVYDESVESAALDPSAEYPVYSDDSREGPAYAGDSREEPAYTDDSREDYAYRDARSRPDRSGRDGHDGRRGPGGRNDVRSGSGRGNRDDADQVNPFDDPRAPSAFRTSRSRPLDQRAQRDQRDGYPPDPSRRSGRGSQGAAPSRGRPQPGGYDDYAIGGIDRRGPQSRGLPPGGDPRVGAGMGGRSMGGPGGFGGPMSSQGMNGGLMPGIPGMGGPMGPTGPAAKSESGRRSIVGIVIGVVAVLLLIAIVASILFIPQIRRHIPGLNGGSGSSGSPGTTSSFATYTPGPTPTVLANDKLFSSTQSQYILNYPTSWGVKNNSNVNGGQYDNYDTFSPSSNIPTIGVEQAGQFASSSDQQIIQSEVDSVKAGATQNHQNETITQIGGFVAQNVGGETWQRAEYSITTGGATLHMSLLACHHNGKGYAIVLLDTASNFHADDQGIFEPTLKSFRFS